MKLMTEISGNDDDVVLTYNGDIDVSGEDQAEHDAAAAHALKQAIASEPEFPGDMPDEMWEMACYDRDALTEAFRVAVKQTKSGILARADELMHAWGFEPEAGK